MTPDQLRAEGWTLIRPHEIAKGTLNLYVCAIASGLDGHPVYLPIAKRPMAPGTHEHWWKVGTRWLTERVKEVAGATYGKKAGEEIVIDATRALEQGFRGGDA